MIFWKINLKIGGFPRFLDSRPGAKSVSGAAFAAMTERMDFVRPFWAELIAVLGEVER